MEFLNQDYEGIVTEIASKEDSLFISGFIADDNRNGNRLLLPKQIMEASNTSFINQPIRMLPTPFTNRPTGHGLNKMTQRFSPSVINIGTILQTYMVNVDTSVEPSEILPYDPESELETRIVFEAKMWKFLYPELAQSIVDIHNEGKLRFSFEAVIGSEESVDGTRVVTSFRGIGIAIVENPAFENAYSLMVASQEQKGENNMDFEKEYNDKLVELASLQAEKDALDLEISALTASKSELVTKVEGLETELTNKNTELASKIAEVDTKDTEISSLSVYKENFETAEKAKVGEKRVACLNKFTDKVEKSTDELIEMSELAFSQYALEIAEAAPAIRRGNFVNSGTKTIGSKLDELLTIK